MKDSIKGGYKEVGKPKPVPAGASFKGGMAAGGKACVTKVK